MFSTFHPILFIIMLILMNSNQERTRFDTSDQIRFDNSDPKRMLVYIYLMDDEFTLPMSDIVCYFDENDPSCPSNGMKQSQIGRASSFLFDNAIPTSIRYTGSATSRRGYGRFPVYVGCAYNCAALHPSSNYEINYFGLRYSKWLADSISFKLELELKN